MSRPPKLTQEDIDNIIILYKKGSKVTDIAINYLVDRKSILYHLNHAGVYGKKPKKRNYTTPKRTPTEHKETNVNLDRKAKHIWLWKETEHEKEFPKSYSDYYIKKFGKKIPKKLTQHIEIDL